jgi:uncharacterized protein (TIGR03086 family)
VRAGRSTEGRTTLDEQERRHGGTDEVGRLAEVASTVGALVDAVGPDQWDAPTPCPAWDVRRLVAHLTGLNRVFAALLTDQPVPVRSRESEPDPAGGYHESTAALLAAFREPGVLERTYPGPLGAATGAERLQIRQYDLLAHGWDLGQALGRSFRPAEDVAEQSLVFARAQVRDESRPGRFGAPTRVAEDAPAIERLVAFLGRTVPGR